MPKYHVVLNCTHLYTLFYILIQFILVLIHSEKYSPVGYKLMYTCPIANLLRQKVYSCFLSYQSKEISYLFLKFFKAFTLNLTFINSLQCEDDNKLQLKLKNFVFKTGVNIGKLAHLILCQHLRILELEIAQF